MLCRGQPRWLFEIDMSNERRELKEKRKERKECVSLGSGG
jgi:hypothetical protein